MISVLNVQGFVCFFVFLGVLPRYGSHKPRSCNPPEPQDLSYPKQMQKKNRSYGNRYSLTEALSLTKDYLSQSTWDDEMDDHECLGLDLPIAASPAGTDDVFMGMVPGSIEGLHYHTGKVSIPSKYQVIGLLTY